MKYIFNTFILIFGIVFSGCIFITESFAFSLQDNYLWVEFTKTVREKDGSVVLPLRINYGRFPGQKKGVEELDSLRVVYSLVEDDPGREEVFYRAEIEKENGNYAVKIKSYKKGRFIIFVEAEKTYGKTKNLYSAKAAFTLFGHSSFQPEGPGYIAASRGAPGLEISISPQFHYWPQIEEPFKIKVLFAKNHLPEKTVYLFDENMPSSEIISGQSGSFIYTPAEDKKLNAKGENAFKQIVLVVKEDKNNFSYISSYTLLLHRNRLKHYRLFPGALIFLISSLFIFFLAVIKRKRFEREII